MYIRRMTVSDPRNHNTIDEMFDLWNIHPCVEIAVQMHPGKVSPDTDRYKWICELVDKLKNLEPNRSFYPQPCFAIHVNNDWCDDICNGTIPDALKPLFDSVHPKRKNHIVGRIQLNMPQKTAENFNAQKLKGVIESFPDQEFIIQYKPITINAVEQLHETGARFSLLFDESGGTGRDAGTWRAPVYPMAHNQGYSGGLSPENIADNLTQIIEVVGKGSIWIDAEGKLKTDGKFDPMRAKQYIQNTLAWELAWEQKHR